MALNSVWLAANFSQALTSANNIESFTPTGGSPQTVHIPGVGNVYCYVDGFPEYSEGESRFDPNGAQSFVGFKRIVYTQSRMHRDTLAWLKSTYRGQVSVNVTLDTTTYTDWNAYLSYETNGRIEGTDWFENVQWIFTLIEEIP